MTEKGHSTGNCKHEIDKEQELETAELLYAHGRSEEGRNEDGTGEDGTGEDGTGEDGTGEDRRGENERSEDGGGPLIPGRHVVFSETSR